MYMKSDGISQNNSNKTSGDLRGRNDIFDRKIQRKDRTFARKISGPNKIEGCELRNYRNTRRKGYIEDNKGTKNALDGRIKRTEETRSEDR